MKLFWRLIAINFRMRFANMGAKRGDDGPKKRNNTWLYVVMGIAFAYLLVIYCAMLFGMYEVFGELGSASVLLGLTMFAAVALSLLMGVVMMISSLFFAKDSELLAGMPIKPMTVFASKFTYVYINEAVTTALILIPSMVMYGLTTGCGAGFYIMMLPVILLLPAIPLVVSALISMLIMNLLARIRNRNSITMVMSLLFVVVYLLGYSWFLNLMNGSVDIAGVISSNLDIMSSFSKVYPPIDWAVNSMTAEIGAAALQFLFLFAVSALALAIVVLLAQKIYYKGALLQLESPRKKSSAKKVRESSQRSVVSAVIRREFISLIKTPVYLMNCVSTVILMPAIFLIIGSQNFGGEGGLPELAAEFPTVVLGVVIGIAGFFATVNTASGTIISREGKGLNFIKGMPIKASDFVKGKMFVAWLLSAIPVVLLYIIMYALTKLNILYLLAGLLFDLGVCGIMVHLCAFVDMRMPKLQWDNPQYVVKQSFNAVSGMLFGMAALITGGLLAFGLWFILKDMVLSVFIIGVILIAVDVFLRSLVLEKAGPMLDRIES